MYWPNDPWKPRGGGGRPGRVVMMLEQRDRNGAEGYIVNWPLHTNPTNIQCWTKTNNALYIPVYATYSNLICLILAMNLHLMLFFQFQLYARGTLCEFREEMDSDRYTRLRSNKMPNWYVGFKKNGKPEKGYKCKKRKCQFLKLYKETEGDKKTFGPDLSNYPSMLNRASQLTQRHSVRHAKSKERHKQHWLGNMRWEKHWRTCVLPRPIPQGLVML